MLSGLVAFFRAMPHLHEGCMCIFRLTVARWRFAAATGRLLTLYLTSPLVPVPLWRVLRMVLEPLLDRFVS
jgi:hypothetical protein